jgi:FMN phosphatase YigB (HAD superfamily)
VSGQRPLPIAVPAHVGGVIFDLDGTLYRMRWFLRPALALRLFPYCFRLSRFLKIRDRFSGVEMGSRDTLIDAVARELAIVERKPASAMRTWILEAFYPAFAAVMPLMRQSRHGVNDVLRSLRERGVRLAVLSDYGMIPERLAFLDIDRSFFDLFVSSEAAGALKPCPRPFAETAAQWGLAPAQVVVIGDRCDTDGAGAKRAGMHFIRISSGRMADCGGHSWDEVKSYLQSIVARG